MKAHNQTLQEDLKQDVKFSEMARLGTLQEETAQFAKKLEVESKRQRDLEALINLTEQQLHDQRKRMSSSNGGQLPALIKEQKTLEIQLEQIKLKHNESLAEINELMEQINTARRERVIFSNVFKKLESDIRIKEEEFKKQLLIRKFTEAQLRQQQEEFDHMKEQAGTVLKNNQQEYSTMIKTNRQEEDTIINNTNILEGSVLNSVQPAITQKQNSSNQKPNQLQKAVDDANQYEFMFEKLKKETGISSIEEIIRLYKCIDQENTELYLKANQLSDQIDQQQNELEQIRKQIQNYTKQTKEVDQELEDAKFKYAMQMEKSEDLDAKIEEGQRQISNFLKDLRQLAMQLQIVLPEDHTEQQLMQAVEQRAYDIVTIQNHYNKTMPNIDRQQKDNQSVEPLEDPMITDLLAAVEPEKDAEKIKTKDDFKEIGLRELNQFSKKQLSHRRKKD